MSYYEQGERPSKPIDEQRAYLEGLRAEQAQVLKDSGIAAKGWAAGGHTLGVSQEATTVSAAITSGQDRDGNNFERPSLKFTTTTHPRNPDSSVSTYVTVAEQFNGTDAVLPADGFSEEDVAIVTGLLDTVRDGQAQGMLRDIAADLTSVVDPSQQSMFL